MYETQLEHAIQFLRSDPRHNAGRRSQSQKPTHAWTTDGCFAVRSLSDIRGQRTPRPTVSRETALAYPAPRLACSLTRTVHDSTCHASWPFGIGGHARVCRVALRGDDKDLIEHRLNLRGIISDLESRCVGKRCCAIVRRTAVCEIYQKRRALVCTRRVASKERRPRTEILCGEFCKGRRDRRERVCRRKQHSAILCSLVTGRQ